LGNAGIKLTGLETTACSKLRPVQSSIENNLVTNEINDAHRSNSGTHLRLKAVVDEGKGVTALTEVTSVKKLLYLRISQYPGIQILDKEDRDIQSVSHSLSPVFVRKKNNEGEEISRKDPDFTMAICRVA
jgi:hypothetical protein